MRFKVSGTKHELLLIVNWENGDSTGNFYKLWKMHEIFMGNCDNLLNFSWNELTEKFNKWGELRKIRFESYDINIKIVLLVFN